MIFIRIDEKPYAVLYADIASRPNVPVNVLVGLEILKAGNGWSDEEMYENYCYNAQVRRVLGLYSLDEGYLSMRTIYVFRERLARHMGETGENLFEQTFEIVIGSAAMVNLRRIQRFQVEQRREATKKAKGKGIKTPLLSLFSRVLATFLKQFYPVTSFSPLYY
ncbi:MAG TPA: transposase [Chloroflexi bacterium]|nr:transposase [Chloroflexota bacterium]